MPSYFHIDDVLLNFDPTAPHARFLAQDSGIELLTAEATSPRSVLWPSRLTPIATPLATRPAETDDLSKFRGFDAAHSDRASRKAPDSIPGCESNCQRVDGGVFQ